MSSHATSTGSPARSASSGASTRLDGEPGPSGAVELDDGHHVGDDADQGGQQRLVDDRVGEQGPGPGTSVQAASKEWQYGHSGRGG